MQIKALHTGASALRQAGKLNPYFLNCPCCGIAITAMKKPVMMHLGKHNKRGEISDHYAYIIGLFCKNDRGINQYIKNKYGEDVFERARELYLKMKGEYVDTRL